MSKKGINLFEKSAEIAAENQSSFKLTLHGKDKLIDFMDANGWFGIRYNFVKDEIFVDTMEPCLDQLSLWLRAYGKNAGEKMELMLDYYGKTFPDTCERFRAYLVSHDRIEKKTTCPVLDFILFSLQKELSQYTEPEIGSLIDAANGELTLTCVKILADFLKWPYKGTSLTGWNFEFSTRQKVPMDQSAYSLKSFSIMAYTIRTDGGKYYLSVRRTRKKKGRKKVYYRVDQDYQTCEYEIPEWLYREIQNYQQATQNEEATSIHTLLIPQRRDKYGYLAYKEMSDRLDEFCQNAFGDRDYPVNLGDTRHIAMISLILSGGSPVICKELAGHENIDISSNYYGNIATVVEDSVYELRHGYSEVSFLNGINRYHVRLPERCIRVDKGWCDVPAVEKGDISECMADYRPGYSLGECLGCRHYYPDDPGIRAELRRSLKKAVNDDGIYLVQMIEIVRKGLGYEEDIAAALLRIKSSARRYGRLLITEGDR